MKLLAIIALLMIESASAGLMIAGALVLSPLGFLGGLFGVLASLALILLLAGHR